MLRIGDRLLDVLALIAATLLIVWLTARWATMPLPDPARQDGGRGLVIAAIEGPGLELDALGGKGLSIRGESAQLLMPELGPLQVNLAPSALQLARVEAWLGDSSLRIRAQECRVDEKALLFSGAVRVDGEQGNGLLFSDRLELSLSADRLTTGPLVVLSPEGDSGGRGGRVVGGFAASLADLLQRSR